jgi:uncharacterized HAD superfamily protein
MAAKPRGYYAVGVDMDGVLVDFITPYAKLLKVGYPSLPEEAYTNPKTYNWDTRAGVPKDVINAVWESIKETRDFWVKLKFIPGKAELHDLYTLAEAIPVYVITSRPDGYDYSITSATSECLDNKNLPNLSVVCSDKKELLVEPLGLRFFIDDKLENVMKVSEKMTELCEDTCVCALLDTAYNQGPLPEGIQRVNSLGEFLDLIYAVLQNDGDVEEVKEEE